jgi:hypothetical protein
MDGILIESFVASYPRGVVHFGSVHVLSYLLSCFVYFKS